MRAALLAQLPDDLAGARVLDAGCGPGQLAMALARRGASVLAIDISPKSIALAKDSAPRRTWPPGSIIEPATCLKSRLGLFDHAVAMDSLIHYRPDDVASALDRLAPRVAGRLLFTLAPRTPLLSAMHAVGKAFPRSDRAPAIAPVSELRLRARAHAFLPGGRAAFGSGRPDREGLLHQSGLPVRAGGRRGREPMIPSLKPMSPKEKRAFWNGLSKRVLPFSDAATEDLPLLKILRLSLFQVSVGMATVMLLGTLNRVMIVELSTPASLVAFMVALPVLIAPFRALLGFRSDHHRSAIGWRRIPYLWFGALWQFGGLAVMPFALLVLSGDQMAGPDWAGHALAAVAFLMTGLGLHMTQTAGLALASDLATEETRPRVVALLYVMFLIGMAISAVVIGALLADFSKLRLIQVVQGAAVATLVLNLVALWRQERVKPMTKAERAAPKPSFREAWRDLLAGGRAGRLLAVVAIGTLGFSMQDVLLEPFGGQILGLSVAATTLFDRGLGRRRAGGLWSRRTLAGSPRRPKSDRGARASGRRRRLLRGCAGGADALGSSVFHRCDSLIGLGAGLFAVATLIDAMTLPVTERAGRGLALGAWGAAQATAAGLGVVLGGALRDGVSAAALSGALGPGLSGPGVGYSFVWHVEIGLLFLTLVLIGPLVGRSRSQSRFGLAEFPT